MNSNRVFQFALLMSAALHVAILFQNSPLFNSTGQKNKKKEDLLEVSYLKLLEKGITQAKESALKIDIPPSLPSRIVPAKKLPPPFIDRELEVKEKKGPFFAQKALFAPSFLKKPEIRPDIIAVKKKINLPHVDIDKINNPSYLSYYQIIREKIRRSAYQNYSTSDMGEVYVSFIVSSSGYLEEARLVEEKSSRNAHLRDIALKSVNDASPFPKFPAQLDYSQLSFNVIISFEIE
jgi:TonB family protein